MFIFQKKKVFCMISIIYIILKCLTESYNVKIAQGQT